jgi:two-component system OmpR family response regulator
MTELRGVILSRAEPEQRIYGWNEEVESKAIAFLIDGLRKKLDTGMIEPVRGWDG